MAARIGMWVVVLVAAIVLAPQSWAGVRRHDVLDSVHTSLADSAAYESVGQFHTVTPGTNYLASGTVIAPDWVLTAGHVVDDVISMEFTVGGTAYAAKQWVPHPKWNGNLSGGYDVALVQLETSVPEALTPATLYTGKNELGATGTSVGFGVTGTGLTGAITSDDENRAGLNVIDSFYGGPAKKARMFLSDFDNPLAPQDSSYGSSTPLDWEYLIAPGDSGGGLFIDLGDGPMLAGVHSFGASFDGLTDSDYGDISGHTRVSKFTGWIEDVTSGGGGKPGKGGGKPDNPGKGNGKPTIALLPTTEIAQPAIPEPGPLALLLMGGAGLFRRRRSV